MTAARHYAAVDRRSRRGWQMTLQPKERVRRFTRMRWGSTSPRGARARRSHSDEMQRTYGGRSAPSSHLCDCGRERRIELRRQATLELPHERDRAVAFVAYIRRWPQAPERAVGGTQPSEQRDVRPILALLDVPLPGRAIRSGCGLAFPV